MPMDLLGGMMGAIVGVYVLVPLFPFLYVVVRWRVGASGEPGTGTLGALQYFRSLSLLGAHVGASLALTALLQMEDSGDLLRSAFAILVASVLFYGINFVCAARAGPLAGDHPVRRVFDGFLLVACGLVGFGALLALFLELFSKRTNTEDVKAALSWGLVWLGGFGGRAYLLLRAVKRP